MYISFPDNTPSLSLFKRSFAGHEYLGLRFSKCGFGSFCYLKLRPRQRLTNDYQARAHSLVAPDIRLRLQQWSTITSKNKLSIVVTTYFEMGKTDKMKNCQGLMTPFNARKKYLILWSLRIFLEKPLYTVGPGRTHRTD